MSYQSEKVARALLSLLLLPVLALVLSIKHVAASLLDRRPSTRTQR